MDLVLILDNIRSSHNVGSILRTCDGLGINEVYLCGITPYPKSKNDDRLPHLAEKTEKQISKTSLGAEKTVKWHYRKSVTETLDDLKSKSYVIAALEQTACSVSLSEYNKPVKLVLIVGNEVTGVSSVVLEICDSSLEIPMHGDKESFNVAVAAAIALYVLMQP
ncbi:MAG: TrmH family RNA methyltransferase [bacterium]|nr:TrmH family RNA methyltransferase [bacterium]